MNWTKRAVSVVLIAAMILVVSPLGLWATSEVPEPGAFFGVPINPKAKGKKLSGDLTVAYEFTDPNFIDCFSLTVNNMFVVTTLQRGPKNIRVFSSDFTKTGQAPICFDDQTTQANFVLGLISGQVIPFFFGCDPTIPNNCPGFELKSVKNPLSSGQGALSVDVQIRVMRGSPDPDDD